MSSVLVRTTLFLSELFFQQVNASHFHVEWIKRMDIERDRDPLWRRQNVITYKHV